MKETLSKAFCANENGKTTITLNGEQIEGEWVEGYYVCLNGEEHRIYAGYAETDCGEYYPKWHKIIPETICHFTGLTDKNSKKIYTDCIIETITLDDNSKRLALVGIGECIDGDGEPCFGVWVQRGETKGIFYKSYSSDIEVIGNIYENPKLLAEGGDKNG